jgi:hypothetical protein
VFSAYARNLFAGMPKPAAATAALNVHERTHRSREEDAVLRFERIYEYALQSKNAARDWAAF